MRSETNLAKLNAFMDALGKRTRGAGRVYLTGGATALIHGWRPMTVDIDVKADPEPDQLFEAIAEIKDQLDVNVELAAPDQFIPPLPGWRDRSAFIARHGQIDFFHYDYYSQTLSKLERGHDRDLADVRNMMKQGLIIPTRLLSHFREIEPALIRYPAIEPSSFRAVVEAFCTEDTL